MYANNNWIYEIFSDKTGTLQGDFQICILQNTRKWLFPRKTPKNWLTVIPCPKKKQNTRLGLKKQGYVIGKKDKFWFFLIANSTQYALNNELHKTNGITFFDFSYFWHYCVKYIFQEKISYKIYFINRKIIYWYGNLKLWQKKMENQKKKLFLRKMEWDFKDATVLTCCFFPEKYLQNIFYWYMARSVFLMQIEKMPQNEFKKNQHVKNIF